MVADSTPQATPERILQSARVIVGFCPRCSAVLVVLNDYEVWPYVRCGCGWGGTTLQIARRHRFERGGYVLSPIPPEELQAVRRWQLDAEAFDGSEPGVEYGPGGAYAVEATS